MFPMIHGEKKYWIPLGKLLLTLCIAAMYVICCSSFTHISHLYIISHHIECKNMETRLFLHISISIHRLLFQLGNIFFVLALWLPGIHLLHIMIHTLVHISSTWRSAFPVKTGFDPVLRCKQKWISVSKSCFVSIHPSIHTHIWWVFLFSSIMVNYLH